LLTLYNNLKYNYHNLRKSIIFKRLVRNTKKLNILLKNYKILPIVLSHNGQRTGIPNSFILIFYQTNEMSNGLINTLCRIELKQQQMKLMINEF